MLRKCAARTAQVLIGICLVLLVAALFAPVANASSWYTTRLTDNHRANRLPKTDGRYVVWQGYDGTDNEILLYDSYAGTTKHLTNNQVDDEQPAVSNGNVVFLRRTGGPEYDPKYDVYLATRSGTRMLAASAKNPDIDGDHVIWTRSDGNDEEVYLYDSSSDSTKRITDNNTEDWGLKVQGNRVFYVHRLSNTPGNYDAECFVYYINSDNRVDTGFWLYDDTFMDPGGDYIAYRAVWDYADGVSLYNIQTGADTTLVESGYNTYELSTDGNHVVWPQGAEASWLEVYDIAGGSREQLTNSGTNPENPYVKNGIICWVQDQDVYVASTSPLPLPGSRFPDVSAVDPYLAAIMGMADRSIINGYKNGDFGPEDRVNRAQFAKMIAGALDLSVTEDLTSPFIDIGPDDPNDSYPHEYIAAAAAAGITTGKTPETYAPWDDLSRAQAVTMFVRGAQALQLGDLASPPEGYLGTLPPFSDVHSPLIRVAEYNGLLTGLVGFDRSWDPWAAATRGEIAQMLWNLLQRSAPPLTQELLYSDDFSDPGTGWPIQGDAGYSLGYQGGRYLVSVHSGPALVYAFGDDSYGDGIVEVDALPTPQTGPYDYGLLVRVGDESNLVYAYVTSLGTAGLQACRTGTWSVLSPEKSSSAISLGGSLNHMKVIMQGGLLRLFVNDALVSEASGARASGKVGVAAESTGPGTAEVYFDNLKVWSLPDSLSDPGMGILGKPSWKGGLMILRSSVRPD